MKKKSGGREKELSRTLLGYRKTGNPSQNKIISKKIWR
jgi:hypothetical protein